MKPLSNSARYILAITASLYLATTYNACSQVEFQQLPAATETERSLACEGPDCNSTNTATTGGLQAKLKIKLKDNAQDPSEPLFTNNRQVMLQVWSSISAKAMWGEETPEWSDSEAADFNEFMPFELKKSGEGKMQVYGKFKDNDTGDTVVVSDDIFLDTVKPQVIFAPQTAKNTPSYMVKAEIKDAEPSSGIASVECTDPVNPAGFKSCLDLVKDVNLAKQLTDLKDRTYHLSVKVRDMAGNESIVNHDFVIDANAPLVSWTKVPTEGSLLNATSVSLQVRVKDSENGNVSSGINRVECSTDKGTTWKTCDAKVDAQSNEVYNLVLATPDAIKYEVLVRAVDNGGNEGRTPLASFTIDRSVPNLTLGVASYYNTNPAVPFTLTSTWPPSTYTATYSCSLKQGTVEVMRPGNCREPGFTLTIPDSDKEYTLEVTGVFTRPENPPVTVVATPVKFMVDSVAPTGLLTLLSAPYNGTTLSNFTLALMDASVGIDPASVKCYVGSATAKTYLPCNVGSFNYQSTLTAGTYNMSMTAEFKDKAGNPGVSNTVNWVMDLDNPVPQITQGPGRLMLGYSATEKVDTALRPSFSFTADASVDPATGFRCSVSGGGLNLALSSCTSAWVLPQDITAGGKVTFTVEATDRGGRKGTASYVWMFDKTLPLLTVNAVNSIFNIGTNTDLSFSLSDTESEVDTASVQCFLRSQSQTNFQAVSCGTVNFSQPATNRLYAIGSAQVANTIEDTYFFKVTGKNIWGMQGESNMVSWTVQNQNLKPGVTDLTVTENKDIDILFVVDNSGSMAGKVEYIGTRFQDFVDRLAGSNWRIGFTTTTMARGQRIICSAGAKTASQAACLIPGQATKRNISGGIAQANSDGGHGMDGRLLDIEGYPNLYWLDKNMGNVNTLFKNTVEVHSVKTTGPYAGLANGVPADGHERALTAAKKALERAKDGSFGGINRNFFREGAQLAVVFVTDEDETSFFQVDKDSNGVDNATQVSYADTAKYLRDCSSNPTSVRCPIMHTEVDEMMTYLRSAYPQKNVVFHSVVGFPPALKELKEVKASDPRKPEFNLKWSTECAVPLTHAGCRYRDIASRTGGEIINVNMGTAADYSESLKAIGNGIRNLVNSVKLSCEPYKGKVTVLKDSAEYTGTASTLTGDTLTFATDLPDGVYKFQYQCL